MAIEIPIVNAVTGLFSGLINAIDDWHTSDEEKLEAKGKIFMAQAQLLNTVFDYDAGRCDPVRGKGRIMDSAFLATCYYVGVCGPGCSALVRFYAREHVAGNRG